MAGTAVVELARAALRRLARAAPTAEAARAMLETLEQVGTGPPYTIAITGELRARTALLDHLAGEGLFDASRRDPRRVVMTMQRGAVTKLRARRRDGSVEERTLEATPSGAVVVDETPSGALVVDEGRIVDEVPVAAEPAVEPAPAPVVADEPTLLVRRPPWWAVWRWLLLWIRSWRSDRHLAPDPVKAIEPARPAPRKPVSKPAPRAGVDPRTQFVHAFRDLFADDAVERIFLEVAGGRLPDKMIVIELPSGADPKVLGATGVDACVVACASALDTTPQLEAVLTIVPHLFAVGPAKLAGVDDRVRWLGDASAVAPALIQVAESERAIAVAGRVIPVLARGRATLDRFLNDAEAGFRDRLARLAARHIPNVDELVAAELTRLRPAIVEHVHRSLRRALTRLDADIARLTAEWSTQLADASSTDALRTAAAKLDELSPAALQAVRTEARRILLDDLTEYTLAQYLEFVSALRQETSRTDPLPSFLEIEVNIGDVTVGTDLGPVAPRLSSLFRSLDALKAAKIAQLAPRIETLRQHVTAIFLDSEPRFEAAVTATLAIALHADAERHGAWLEAELAREQAAIDAERKTLAAITTAHAAAIADERKLVASVEALEQQLP